MNNILRLHFVTYNVGTSTPDQDLNELLGLSAHTDNNDYLPDFYVTSFQEIKAQPQNVVAGSTSKDPWSTEFIKVLGPLDYVKIRTIALQGLLLNVFCLRKHLLNVQDIEAACSRTGVLGVWGNKGGVCVRLEILGCSICFVNSHLAAHDDKLEDRVVDYHEIIKEVNFEANHHPKIFFHDYVFWMGDLNFRISEEYGRTPEEIEQSIKNGDLEELYEHDQLLELMKSGQAFGIVSENRPTFPPTFKYIVGTTQYNYKRRPAWTDRILFRANPHQNKKELKVEQQTYKSHSSYLMSDHKPVTASFIVKVPEVSHSPATSEMAVQFEKISYLNSKEENNIFYTVNKEIPKYREDWIGIFKDDYSSLDEYLASKSNKEAKPVTELADVIKFPVTYKLTFPEVVGQSSTMYRFIYFSKFSENSQSILGISEPFSFMEK